MKSAQNQLISSEIFPENSHEIGLFLSIACFSANLALKIFHESPAKFNKFFCESVSENPVKFDFFPGDLTEALSIRLGWKCNRKLN